MSATRPYTLDRVVRILATLAILAAAIWLINILKNVLLPFCVACLIAYLLEPVVEFVQRITHLKGRIIPVLLTLIVATFIIFLLGYFFIPSIVKEIHQVEDIIHRRDRKSVV